MKEASCSFFGLGPARGTKTGPLGADPGPVEGGCAVSLLSVRRPVFYGFTSRHFDLQVMGVWNGFLAFQLHSSPPVVSRF